MSQSRERERSRLTKYLLQILKAILVSSLGVGGGVGLLLMIFVLTNRSDPNAFKYGMTAGLAIGIIFALFLVAVLIPLDLSAYVFKAKGGYKQIWDLEQVREFEIKGTAKQALHYARQALLLVPYVVEVSDDVEHMITRAKTGASWRSGGEVMEVEINPLSANDWTIKITSKPYNKKAVFDYGKNFENVETFSAQVKKMAQAIECGGQKNW